MNAVVGWMEGVLEWLKLGVTILFLMWVIAALPMLIFRRSRPYGAAVLVYSSFFTAFSCWWFCFVVCYRLLGVIWLVVGNLFFGVGVIPLTFVGLMVKSFWTPGLGPWTLYVFESIMLFLVPRVLGGWILDGCEKAERERLDSIDGDSVSTHL